MHNAPLVSIIIPTFNRSHLIGETLDSVLAQTYQNWECIVVDDGSTDNTNELMAEYIAKDARFQYHLRPEDRLPGGNAARNYGFEVSQGDFVQWFDDDDIMLHDFLERKILNIELGIDLIISPSTFWDPVMNGNKENVLKETNNIYRDYLLWRLGILTPGVLFRKSFLRNHELFGESVIRGQETEFFLRLFYKLPRSSYKIINDYLFLYRQHDHNKTSRDISDYKESHANSKYYIYYKNYVKLKSSGDNESIHFCYERLLSVFYSSLYHKHKELSKKIIREYFPLLKSRNYLQAIEIIIIANIFYVTRRVSYKIIDRWKKFDF